MLSGTFYYRGISDLIDISITSGSSYPSREYLEPSPIMDDSFLDKLLAKMMVHTKKVIIPCRFCGSHNAFSNSNCIQCGAPMGDLEHA